MQHAYYNATTGLYTQADAWPYSQAMAATISLAGLPGLHSRYQPDLIVMDECHHAVAGTWQRVIRAMPKAKGMPTSMAIPDVTRVP